MKTLFKSLLMCISLLFIHSCKPDCEASETHQLYTISADNISKIPFKSDGLDILSFSASSADSAFLYGEGIEKGIFTLQLITSNKDCPSTDYTDGAFLCYTFTGPKLPKLYLYFLANYDKCEGYCSRVWVDPETVLTAPLNDDNYYYDTLTVNGLPINGIELIAKHSDRAEPDSTLSVFYNYKYGILRIKDRGKVWMRRL